MRVWRFVIEPVARDQAYQLLLNLKEKSRPLYEPFGEIDAYNDVVQIPDDLMVLFDVSQMFVRAANAVDLRDALELRAGLMTFAVEVMRRMVFMGP